MQDCLLERRPEAAIPIHVLTKQDFNSWLTQQQEPLKRWLSATGFTAQAGQTTLIPGDEQQLAAVVTAIDTADEMWALAGLPAKLPAGDYYLARQQNAELEQAYALGWASGTYRFSRYKNNPATQARLAVACDLRPVYAQASAIALVRDLINTPAEDMMPRQLAEVIEQLGQEFDATVSQVIGDDLLQHNYPVIHAVGRASVHTPRLIELTWGNPKAPKLSLVGKGVCFDSGGLDIKSANNMRLMKKDMGGAAHAIGLARLVMANQLPVRLQLLVPAVENAIAGNAFRPGDIIRSRQGLSIEVDNTDAEGRLILCDALTKAVADKPELIVDFATLTGAARVAVGTEIAAFFSNEDAAANGLNKAAQQQHDPIWRLPLHQGYRSMLESRFADIANSAASPFGGAVTAALFLQAFVPDTIPWVHFDIMAWNNRSRPGRPEGGEAMGMRAVYAYLEQRFNEDLT